MACNVQKRSFVRSPRNHTDLVGSSFVIEIPSARREPVRSISPWAVHVRPMLHRDHGDACLLVVDQVDHPVVPTPGAV